MHLFGLKGASLERANFIIDLLLSKPNSAEEVLKTGVATYGIKEGMYFQEPPLDITPKEPALGSLLSSAEVPCGDRENGRRRSSAESRRRCQRPARAQPLRIGAAL